MCQGICSWCKSTDGYCNCVSRLMKGEDQFIIMADMAAVQIMKTLSVEDILYASDPARGEYKGFAALHDLCDANMLLPSFIQDIDDVADACAVANLTFEKVTALILEKA